MAITFLIFVRAVAEVSVNGCWACNHGLAWLVSASSGLHFSPEIRGFEEFLSLFLGYFYSLNFIMIRKVLDISTFFNFPPIF